MKNTLIIFFLLSLRFTGFAQTASDNCCDIKPYIEVTGSAEMEIVPDEIYITAILQERYDGKTKVTIEKMETDMFTALKNAGIESKNISLADAGNNFVYRKRKEDDALLSRSYTIQVADAASVIKVFDVLGKIDAYNAYISKTSHSKIEEYRMQTKVDATVAAKEKANKMLTAVGNKAGKAILIQEVNENYQPYQHSQYSNASFEMENMVMLEYDSTGGQANNIAYKKIKLRYEVFARFEIN